MSLKHLGNKNVYKHNKQINKRTITGQIDYLHSKKDIAYIYAKYYPYIKRFIASDINSMADVEDLTHDVFINLYKARIPLSDDRIIKGYLKGIAKNLIRSYIRCERKRKIKLISIDNIEDIYPYIKQKQDEEETYFNQNLKSVILDLKIKLSHKLFETVALSFFGELSFEQAVRRVGCSMQAYKKRLQRAARIFEQTVKQIKD